jgi:peptidoglycan/xylan/chitin deacetylase (PgdA/CDA1 family)
MATEVKTQGKKQAQGAGARWPDGSKVAVVFQFVFEQWAGSHVEPGRHTAPQLPLSAIKDGVRDLVSLSWQDYAGRAGFYRLMDTAHANGIKATGLFNGLAVEKYPDIAREFVEQGNEIAGHSWSEEVRSYRQNEAETRADVQKTRKIIQDVTGAAPVGWSSAGHQGGAHTLDVVAKEGFTYVVERVDDDRPALLEGGGRKLVGFSPSFDINDHQFYARGLNGPGPYIETFARQVDTLLAEESDGLPWLVTAVFHATLFGHPLGAWALRECIRHARGTEGVWIATHRECAEHCLAQSA